MPLRIPIARAEYYWIYGTNSSTGNYIVLGPYHSEDEARDNAGNLGEPRFFKLPTRDPSKATRMIKAKVFKREGIGRAMKRVGHSVSGTSTLPEDEGDNKDDDDI